METTTKKSPIVSAEWLAENLGKPNVVVLDATIPPIGKQKSEMETAKIKGAIFFDLDNVFSDTQSNLPHTILSPNAFTDRVQALGINQESIIVVYDTVGVYSSPRAWWLFRAMGHEQVFVLNGGFPAWKQINGEYEQAAAQQHTQRGNFLANYQPALVRDANAVLTVTQDTKQLVIDARSSERFWGKVAEPREGLRRGHIPNSANIPFTGVLDGGKLKTAEELQQIFTEVAAENKELVFSCGSGVTACIVALGAEIAGFEKISVYDGSWSEWGMSAELPII
ncbi:MAG: 3-mercaptopyruvate sulfurtransferase [Cytophagales bacterium]|nr:MAG: 3-mercaptopyruvate sulfurtransferase [Cytophagales bacterium]